MGGMTTAIDVMSAMQAARKEWDQHRQTVNLLMINLGFNRTQLAEKMGMKRPTLNNRLDGHTPFTQPELVGVGVALGLPTEVLEKPARDALRWVLDNRPAIIRNRCSSLSTQRAA